MNWKCKVGIHNWKQSRPVTSIDSFPPHFIPYIAPTRTCSRCGKTQKWLPGYGGSEIGSWENTNPKHPHSRPCEPRGDVRGVN